MVASILQLSNCEENVKKQTCSGRGLQARYCTEYVVTADEKEDVFTILSAKIPAIQFGPAGEILTDSEITSISRVGEDCYTVAVCWRNDLQSGDPKRPGENVSFQFGVQTSSGKRGSSYETQCFTSSQNGVIDQRFTDGAPITEFNGTDCTVVGCDVLTPNKTYCETHCIERDFVTKEYCRELGLAVGAVNQFAYRDCEPCEMLMTSASFSRPNTRSDWTATFCWAIAPNIVETWPIFIQFQGGVDPLGPFDNINPEFDLRSFEVGGWDHVQIDAHCYTDPNGIAATFIEGVKIHRVYRKYNFNAVVPPSTQLLVLPTGTHPMALRDLAVVL